MLEEALLVAAKHHELKIKEAQFVEDLKKLPLDELRSVVETGEIKLAFFDCGPSVSGSQPWVEHFKGTPFFEQAIGLEQEELQAQMAAQQESSVEQQKSQQRWSLMDQIRLKKRLLELQKARNESQVLSGGGGPPNMTGSGAGAEAQGAGALGPVAPEGQQEGSGDAHKLGSVKKAFAITEKGHKFDSEYYGMKARHAAEEMGLLQQYGAMGSATRTGSLGSSLRFGAPPAGEDPRHYEYAAKKHQEGKNAWNPFGGVFTPSSHESEASTLQYGEMKPPKEHKKTAAFHSPRELKRVGAAAAGTGAVFGALGAAGAGKKADPKSKEFSKRHPRTSAALHEGTAGAILGGTLGAIHSGLKHPGRLQREAKDLATNTKDKVHGIASHIKGEIKHKFPGKDKHEIDAAHGKMMSMMRPKEAEAFARQMAQADMAKISHAQNVLVAGDHLGRLMAKSAGVLGQVGKWALEHPQQAGAVAGGTLGAAHGLLREGGGLGEAAAEGVAGAGLGHAAGGIAGGMRGGNTFATSAKMYGQHVKNEGMKLSDRLKSVAKPAISPEASSLGAGQVQKLE